MIAPAFLFAAVALASSGHSTPALVDPPVADYYGRAIQAAETGEPHKGLAMFDLLLLPKNTTLYVDLAGLPAETANAYSKGVDKALALWQSALGSDFPIHSTQQIDKASIVVRFVKSIPDGVGDTMGEIRTRRRIQWNNQVHYSEFTADIDVARSSAKGTSVGEDEVAQIVAHEIGHALGLGDTEATDRLMGPLVMGNPFVAIHPSELQSVKEFRSLVRAQMGKYAVLPQTQGPKTLTFSQ
jgi:hypothetical protein